MIADSALVSRVVASPNHGARAGGRTPDAIVLHYTGMATGEMALSRLCDPAAQVSSHYLIWEDGRIDQLVPEAQRAWHAGASCWRGERDMNSASIGIEIVNGGHDFGLPPFPAPQIDAVIALCHDVVARRRIAPTRVLAHSDIAPGRKIDPGEKFPWRELATRGVGAWPVNARPSQAKSLRQGDRGAKVVAVQRALADFGYDIAVDGIFGPCTHAVIEAFQRRFRPLKVDGVMDGQTRGLLRALAVA